MGGPEKPFSCPEKDCGASFTNEDRLAVHSKKHDMSLHLGIKGAVFVADQTPTPTRFIKNCEDVGLFQDLQNVNPFDETFKRAIESKSGGAHTMLIQPANANDDTLHTPHIFPHLAEESSSVIYSSKSHTKTVTVSRSTADVDPEHLIDIETDISGDKEFVILENKTDEDARLKTFFKPADKTASKNDKSIVFKRTSTPSLKFTSPINTGTKADSEKAGNDTIKRLRIPEISISENEKEFPVSPIRMEYIEDKVDKDDTNLLKNQTSLNDSDSTKVPMTPKKNRKFPLMSQESIEFAFAEFTTVESDRAISLNSISMEDISASDDSPIKLIGDSATVDAPKPVNLTVNESYVVGKLPQSKSGVVDRLVENVSQSNTNVFCTDDAVPVLHIRNKDSQSSKNNKTGDRNSFEVLLTLPNGKKVHFQEVIDEDKADSVPSNNVIIRSLKDMQNHSQLSKIDVINPDTNRAIRKKLKEFVQENIKNSSTNMKIPTRSNLRKKIPIRPLKYSPDNKSNVNVIPINDHTPNATIPYQIYRNILSNIPNRDSDESQNKTSDVLKSNNQISIPESGISQKKQEVVFLNPIPFTIIPKPPPEAIGLKVDPSKIIITKSSSSSKETENKSPKKPPPAKSKSSKVEKEKITTDESESLKKKDYLERNKAAQLRYRTRKRATFESVMNSHRRLQLENKCLSDRLAVVLQENEILKGILAKHSKCSLQHNDISNK